MLRPGLYSALAALLILGAFWSVRLARADYSFAQPDAAQVASACRLAPGSSAYWLRHAAFTDAFHPEDPAIDAAIDRAIELNPRAVDAHLARAVRHETRGDLAAAERDYLDAERLDHMYKPMWALANFYIRHQRPEEFWTWARKCLEVVEPRRLAPVSYNPAPIFDLAWGLTDNADEIRRRLIPPRHFILVDYLEYLGERNLVEAGAAVAVDLTAYGDPGDNYHLLNFCDRLIYLGKAAPALAIWNAMVARATVNAEPLDPAHGVSLSNAGLRRTFERAGFDWLLPPAEGVVQNHFLDPGEVRFEFNGDQPDGVVALYQNVPVVSGGGYRLTFRYRTENMPYADGVLWQGWDYAGKRIVPIECRLAPNAEWTEGEARFSVPPGTSILRIGLISLRATGHTRVHGTIAFSNFALTVANQGDRL